LKKIGNQTVVGTIDFHSMGKKNTMEVNRAQQRFGSTWGWV